MKIGSSVVFVNYHSEDKVKRRAARMLAAGFEVVVADNSGTYPPGEEVLVSCGTNLGFGAACNAAVAAAARHDVIVFHNPDVDIDPVSLRQLVAAVRSHRIGLLAPAEQTAAGTRTRGYAYPSVLREAIRPLAAEQEVSGERHGRTQRWSSLGPRSRRFGGGGLLVASRDAYEEVGGFDTRYFLYGEDLDLWHRVRQAGYPVEFTTAATYLHESHTGSPMSGARRELLRWLSIELFAELHRGPASWRLLRQVHRRRLPTLAPDWPSISGVVAKCWRSGVRPQGVLAEVRPMLEAHLA